jgi:hypothetical protein
VYLFDTVRFWAYDHFNEYKEDSLERWAHSVLSTAIHLNSASFDHVPFLAGRGLLPPAEVTHIAKSVARWTWKNRARRRLSASFSKRQSERGSKGAAATAALKRERREKDIADAVGKLTAQDILPTMGRVAKLLGCAKSTLSAHYGHLFYTTLH